MAIVPTLVDSANTGSLQMHVAAARPDGVSGTWGEGSGNINAVHGSLTIFNPDGTPAAQGSELVGDYAPMEARLLDPAAVDGLFALHYDSDHLKVTFDDAGSNVVTSDATTFTPDTGGTVLYVWATDDRPAVYGGGVDTDYTIALIYYAKTSAGANLAEAPQTTTQNAVRPQGTQISSSEVAVGPASATAGWYACGRYVTVGTREYDAQDRHSPGFMGILVNNINDPTAKVPADNFHILQFYQFKVTVNGKDANDNDTITSVNVQVPWNQRKCWTLERQFSITGAGADTRTMITTS